MEAIYLEPNDRRQLEILTRIASKLGIKSRILSDDERKYIAGLKMIEAAEKHPKYNISDEEINQMMKESEDDIYGKKKNKDNM